MLLQSKAKTWVSRKEEVEAHPDHSKPGALLHVKGTDQVAMFVPGLCPASIHLCYDKPYQLCTRLGHHLFTSHLCSPRSAQDGVRASMRQTPRCMFRSCWSTCKIFAVKLPVAEGPSDAMRSKRPAKELASMQRCFFSPAGQPL